MTQGNGKVPERFPLSSARQKAASGDLSHGIKHALIPDPTRFQLELHHPFRGCGIFYGMAHGHHKAV
jgi:hypothetical protein